MPRKPKQADEEATDAVQETPSGEDVFVPEGEAVQEVEEKVVSYHVPRYVCSCGSEFPPERGVVMNVQEDVAVLTCLNCGREHRITRPIVQL